MSEFAVQVHVGLKTVLPVAIRSAALKGPTAITVKMIAESARQSSDEAGDCHHFFKNFCHLVACRGYVIGVIGYAFGAPSVRFVGAPDLLLWATRRRDRITIWGVLRCGQRGHCLLHSQHQQISVQPRGLSAH